MDVYIESASNTGYYRIVSSTYLTIGNSTAVVLDRAPTVITESGTINEVVYVLTKWFYPANVFPSGPTDITYVHPYGELQIRSIINQYRRHCRIVSGGVMGLTPASHPDLIYKYSLTDNNSNLNDRFFMLVSYEQDWKTGAWSGTFIEVYHQEGKIYTDDREFKFITNG
jgi:hypothetical protein